MNTRHDGRRTLVVPGDIEFPQSVLIYQANVR